MAMSGSTFTSNLDGIGFELQFQLIIGTAWTATIDWLPSAQVRWVSDRYPQSMLSIPGPGIRLLWLRTCRRFKICLVTPAYPDGSAWPRPSDLDDRRNDELDADVIFAQIVLRS